MYQSLSKEIQTKASTRVKDRGVIVTHPISALDQFDARIVASEEIHSQLKFIQSDRPIIFVAHSLGGLIVKDVRLRSPFLCQIPSLIGFLSGTWLFESSSGYQIFSVPRGIIFLGTPH